MRRAIAVMLVLVLAASGIVTFLPVKAEPKTINVPDDYSTISGAIAGAGEGDTIFIKKGIYQEQTLEINKSLTILGEDVNETILNLDPPLVETMIFHNRLWVPSVAITIKADKVKLQGLSINMTEGDYGFGSGLSGFGDCIEIVGNKIGKGGSLQLNGSLLNVSENSLASTLVVAGSNQVIARNSIEGYLIIQGSFNRISGNTVNGGINLKGSFNLVIDNIFPTMSMEHSDSNFISDNSFGCLVVGDFGNSCSNNIVCKNKVTGTGLWGILMSAGRYNVFHDNLVSNYADGYGIAIGGAHLVAEYNIFYRNILINNSRHVGANWEIEGAGNIWDNGSEGNYWDDYKGADRNHDGIGDSPYTIGETRWEEDLKQEVTIAYVQDNYPLMSPFDIDSVSIELPEWASRLSNSQPASEPFLVVPVAAASAVAVAFAACLLLYFKKRRR
jgi:nitrous oxidase accessory protein